MVQGVTDQSLTGEFPFTCKVSLEPILKAWQTDANSHPLLTHFAKDVMALQKNQPTLFDAYTDTDFLRQPTSQALVELLLSPVMSGTTDKRNLAAVARPYYYDFIYTTPAFKALLLDESGNVKAQSRMDAAGFNFGRTLHASITIAKQCYGIDFEYEKHPVMVATDQDTGLNRYFHFFYDTDYLEVKALSRSKKPTAKQIEKLRQDILDMDAWRQVIKPEDYELQGVVIVHAVDMTEREVVSNLYQTLTNGTSLISQKGMKLFNQSVRDMLGRSDVNVRILGKQADMIFMIAPGCSGSAGCLLSNSHHFSYDDLANSVYVASKKQDKDFYVVKDVAALDPSVPVHKMLQADGIGSLILFPLYDNGEPVGILQLDSHSKALDHADLAVKMSDMTAIATLGLKHSQQMLTQSVRSIIQEKSSVVHKSVEWRFQNAALDSIMSGQGNAMEEIIFREVYPLFSESDIKDSSKYRNQAIETDLRTQLGLARQVLQAAQAKKAMPILDEINFRLERYLQGLNEGLRSGDEVTMNNFFRQELEPVFGQLQRLGDDVEQVIQHYRSQLDPRYGTIHQQRKDYEESVLTFNDTIARFVDQEQKQAQSMFPHYFEKTCTDGVEMMMYLGASMVEDGNFDPFYLRNLRLWQLRITCEIARLCEELKPRLKLPLEATHLILVQDAPMSIRFSETERNFIVDGAYNIRYEIMKKRIDKAVIDGGTERLTQPGKIAIVYSHNKEALEYRRYIEFLQHQGLLLEPVEDLVLEALQGLQGLRALRVTVNTQNQSLPKAISDLLQPQEHDRVAATATVDGVH